MGKILIAAICFQIILFSVSCRHHTQSSDWLVMVYDSLEDTYSYENASGQVIIPPGKYPICYTDTFKNYALVLHPEKGFVAIDRNEQVLYNSFPFDNGPDEPAEGLFRIVIGNKIGYADAKTGRILIKPRFDCAWPFENGMAKVSDDFREEPDGEHTLWVSDHWYYINRKGLAVKHAFANMN